MGLRRRSTTAAAATLVAVWGAGCAPAGPRGADTAAAAPPIAAVHARQCGRCHAPPERGEHSRTTLENAFVRHRRRVRLTEDEWAEMAAYLAGPDPASHAPRE